MTTATFRDNILAVDSCFTYCDDSKHENPKYRVSGNKLVTAKIDHGVSIAMAGRGDDVDGCLLEKRILEFFTEKYTGSFSDTPILQGEEWNQFSMGKIKFTTDDEVGVIFMIVDHGKVYAFLCEDPRVVRRIPPGEFVAIGIDAPVAYGALEAGASAVDAVHAACKYGAYSAAPVRYVKAETMVPNASHYPSWIRADQKPA